MAKAMIAAALREALGQHIGNLSLAEYGKLLGNTPSAEVVCRKVI